MRVGVVLCARMPWPWLTSPAGRPPAVERALELCQHAFSSDARLSVAQRCLLRGETARRRASAIAALTLPGQSCATGFG